jgi:hypothetical protein
MLWSIISDRRGLLNEYLRLQRTATHHHGVDFISAPCLNFRRMKWISGHH